MTRPGIGFKITTVIAMTTASLLVMWLADQITQHGVGNGTSLIIMINITSRLPVASIGAWTRYFGLGGITATRSPVELLLLLIFGFLIMMGTVMLTQGVRKVPIHSTRRSARGGNSYGMQQTYMPLRVNYTGVMPIIFAGPLIQFPAALLSRIPAEIRWLGWLKWIGAQLSDMTSPLHLTAYALLIMFFAFFWVATQFNAMQISDSLKREGSYVPGIRPGRATAVSGCVDDARHPDWWHGSVDHRPRAAIPARHAGSALGNGLVFRRHQLADHRGRRARHAAPDGIAPADAQLRRLPEARPPAQQTLVCIER